MMICVKSRTAEEGIRQRYPGFRFLAVILFAFGLLCACISDRRFSRTSPESRFISQPSEQNLRILEGVSSYYGPKFHGKLTANGETFDMYKMTAAHKTLPFGTKIKVTNLDNNKNVVVVINDRGPFVKNRILDLSFGAAKRIDMIGSGTARVRIEILEMGKNK